MENRALVSLKDWHKTFREHQSLRMSKFLVLNATECLCNSHLEDSVYLPTSLIFNLLLKRQGRERDISTHCQTLIAYNDWQCAGLKLADRNLIRVNITILMKSRISRTKLIAPTFSINSKCCMSLHFEITLYVLGKRHVLI